MNTTTAILGTGLLAAAAYLVKRSRDAASIAVKVDPPPTTPIPANKTAPKENVDLPGSTLPSSDGAIANQVYTTPFELCRMPPMVPWTLPDGRQCMMMTVPLGDAARGPHAFARLTYGQWREYARKNGIKMLTIEILIDMHKRGLEIEPCILPAGIYMSSLAWANKEDACIWAELEAAGYTAQQVVSNAGKQWLEDSPGLKSYPPSSTPRGAINAGWFSSKAPNGRMYQSPGYKHNIGHTDYSQLSQGYILL